MLVGFVLLLIAGCSAAKGPLVVIEQSQETTTVFTIGSVLDVIGGVPPAPNEWIRLADYQAGFEAGSPRGTDGIGEFIAFNGVGYSKSTRQDAGYYKLVSGSTIVSNGALFVPIGAKPALRLAVRSPITLDQLYDDIYSRLKAPLCLVGVAEFQRYHATAIAKAPIAGENIFERRDIYYNQPSVDEANVPAGVMACVSTLQAMEDPKTKDGLGAVLYNNPMDPIKGLASHTHVLRLSKAVEAVTQIEPTLAVDVHHMYQDSIVTTGRFEVFVIGGFGRAATVQSAP